MLARKMKLQLMTPQVLVTIDVGLDDDHLEKKFDFEMDPHSDSDFDHELYDDDGQPLVDSDGTFKN